MASTRGNAKTWSWWAVFSLVGMTVVCFIVFDLLDLDESRLRNELPGRIVIADTVDTEMERVPHLDGDLPMTPDGERNPRPQVAQPRLAATCCATVSGERRTRFFPVCLHPRKELTSRSSALGSSDPA